MLKIFATAVFTLLCITVSLCVIVDCSYCFITLLCEEIRV